MTISFVDKVRVSRSELYLYHFVVNHKETRSAWYIMTVSPSKRNDFEHALTIPQNLGLESYGHIVSSGFGDKVPEEELEKAKIIYTESN